MKGVFFVVRFVLVAAFSSGVPILATSVLPDKGTRGIAAVCVEFHVLDETPVLEPWPELEQEFRQQLENGGVRTVDVDVCDRSRSNATLFLSVSGIRSASGKLWAYAVHLELSQAVTLRRDPSQTLDDGVTLSSLKLGLASTERVATSVRADAIALAKSFSKFYRFENRKR
jgi:hypothetical protein